MNPEICIRKCADHESRGCRQIAVESDLAIADAMKFRLAGGVCAPESMPMKWQTRSSCRHREFAVHGLLPDVGISARSNTPVVAVLGAADPRDVIRQHVRLPVPVVKQCRYFSRTFVIAPAPYAPRITA